MSGPINYLTNVKSPVESALQGYSSGLQIRKQQGDMQLQQEKMQKNQQERERAKALQADLGELMENPDIGSEGYSRLMLKYPEMSDHFKQSYDMLSSEQQQNKLEQMTQVYSALETGDLDVAKELLENQKAAAKNAGLTDEEKQIDITLRQLEMNRNAVRTSTRLGLSALMGEDKFSQTFSQLESTGAKRDKLRKESREQIQKSKDKNVLDKRAANTVTTSINELRTMIAEDKGVKNWPHITGVTGSVVLPFLNQNRVDAEATIKTIVANIGFDRLQQMRDASKTGGALGQISDRELETLQAVMGSLSLKQSESQLTKNLDKLDKIYKGILAKANAYDNAAEFGFGGSDPLDLGL